MPFMKHWAIQLLFLTFLISVHMLKCASCNFRCDHEATLARHEHFDCKTEKKTLQDAIAKRKRREELEEEGKGSVSRKKSKGDINSGTTGTGGSQVAPVRTRFNNVILIDELDLYSPHTVFLASGCVQWYIIAHIDHNCR